VWAVEARVGSRLTDEQLRGVRERLAGCRAEIVVEEEGVRLGFRVQAELLGDAVAQALSRLGGQLPIARLNLMTPKELERERPQLPDLLGIVEIQELAGLASKQRAFQVARLPGFPAPALETRAGRFWTRASVEDFLRCWPRRPGRPRRECPETTITPEEKES
jgi:hypothetical protein